MTGNHSLRETLLQKVTPSLVSGRRGSGFGSSLCEKRSPASGGISFFPGISHVSEQIHLWKVMKEEESQQRTYFCLLLSRVAFPLSGSFVSVEAGGFGRRWGWG